MSPAGAPRPPTGRRVVVDGSNLATEGRSTPSLAQLDEAVRAFHAERPNDEIIVVVDASFGYRIDESERKIFEEAEEAGEIVSPPAGAIGRGDGFLLRIADRIDADVLSNDSFQEFHGEHEWLFVRLSDASTVSVTDSTPLPASDAEYESCFWPEFHPVDTPSSDGAAGCV